MTKEPAALNSFGQSAPAGRIEECPAPDLLNVPRCANDLYASGLAAHQQQDFDRATALIRRAIEIDPTRAEYCNALGNVYKDQGNLDAALGCYQKAVELNSDFAEAFNNLGNAHKFKGQINAATDCYQKALYIHPQFDSAHYNLGILYSECGRFEDAMACYHNAIHFNPGFIDAHFNLGNIFRTLGNLEKAIQCYHRALEINPQYAEAYNGLGTVYQEQGKPDKAVECYQQHLDIKADAGVEIKAALLLPVICESNRSIGHDREQLADNLKNLGRKNLRIQDPVKQIGKTNFFLAYHGLSNRILQKEIASFYLNICPNLGWQAPRVHSGSRTQNRLNLGIISQHLRNHTIGYLNYGLIKYLDRDKFHVTVFIPSGIQDELTRDIAAAADENVILPPHVFQARQIIAQRRLDILLYPDIGMDPFTYFLAFSRLAPVQCTTWGHPDTTGIPNMDYYISSLKAEPPGAQAHYSEKLILLDQFLMYNHRTEPTVAMVERKDLNLPEEAHLYACTQSLFKVHPDFDVLLAAILERDPQGMVLFFEGKHAHWTKLLRRRLARTLPHAAERVRFLNRLARDEFLAFLNIPDALLDTPHFSGGYTSLLAMSQGAPVVTWPGEFMRGRLTYALYKQLGILDCVAREFDHYVDIACRLAGDNTWRDTIRNKIKRRARILFENHQPLREVEDFFQWAWAQARGKQNIR